MSESPIWHHLSVSKIFELLKTKRTGLTSEEAARRLKKIGQNFLPEEKKMSRLIILLSQLKSPLVYILIFASVVSVFLKNWVDFLIISIVILVNTVIGFIQEDKANNAIAQLKKIVRFKASVIRDGLEHSIGIEQLVPGDIILLKAGDKVPADARLFEARELKVIEAALTGESEPSSKSVEILNRGAILADRENMVYMGTVVASGKGRAVVCETGVSTQVGKIALMIKDTPEDKTPLQNQLSKFSNLLTLVVSLICAGIVVIGILKGMPFFSSSEAESGKEGILYTAIALAVSAIPEGLLVAVTVILALGMQRILKQKALVRKLVATETLGSTSIICTDKTGTITEGKMQVYKIITPEDEFLVNKDTKLKILKKKLDYFLTLKISAMCNNAFVENPSESTNNWKILGDPAEVALLAAAAQADIDRIKHEKKEPRIEEIPFTSERKFMATRHKLNSNDHIIYLKGAPEVILDKCTSVQIEGENKKISSVSLDKLKNKYEKLTAQGLRVLATAYRHIGAKANFDASINQLVFVGFVALKDPIRKEAKETFALCKQAGIKTIIVTGDHKLTAKAIGKEIGLKVGDENILEGKDLDKMDDKTFSERISKITIYSRVNPGHKLRIIDAWQKKGEVVAMTGDGVNDAPAIKSADIGIALGSGTDVAKETSDMILLDNNFNTIVAAINQGRIIFDNIRKVILYLLADCFSEIILVSGSLIFGLPLPILPAQILWINLINDGLPAIAMTVEPGEVDIMNDKPRKRKEPVLNLELKVLIFIIGIIVNIILFCLFVWLLKCYDSLNLVHIRTIIFSILTLDSLLYSFSVRSLRHSIFTKNIFSNKALVLSVLFGIILLLLAVYQPHLQKILKTVPLSLMDWGIVVGLSFISVIGIEISKHFFIVRNKKNASG